MDNQTAASEFSMIMIPDTQVLSNSHPDIFMNLAKWIVNNAYSLQLKMVLHLGDVVHCGASEEIQFKRAKAALDLIDEAGIPMLIVPGNHDYDNMLETDRSLAMFNEYFGMVRYRNKSWFGGVYEEGKAENSYASLDINGRKFLFVALEYGPRDEVLHWASQILQRHDDHEAIVISHVYMYMNGERTTSGHKHNPKNYQGATGANDGEDMWQKCFRKHHNVVGVYSGHHIHDNVSYRVDLGDHQNHVFQSFQNWQCTENGGEGRVRILNFRPDENKLQIRVMNTHTGLYETSDGYEVCLPLRADSDWKGRCAEIKFPVSGTENDS